MRRVSKEVLRQLEFDEIIELAKRYAKGPGSIQRFEQINFDSTVEELNEELDRVTEVKEILENPGPISIHDYEDVENDLFYLKKENYALDSASVLRINRVLVNFQSISDYFEGKKKRDYSNLYHFFEYEDFYSPLIQSIGRIFDVTGALKKDASPELSRIFRIISSKEKEIDKVFNQDFVRL